MGMYKTTQTIRSNLCLLDANIEMSVSVYLYSYPVIAKWQLAMDFLHIVIWLWVLQRTLDCWSKSLRPYQYQQGKVCLSPACPLLIPDPAAIEHAECISYFLALMLFDVGLLPAVESHSNAGMQFITKNRTKAAAGVMVLQVVARIFFLV